MYMSRYIRDLVVYGGLFNCVQVTKEREKEISDDEGEDDEKEEKKDDEDKDKVGNLYM